MPPQIKVRKNIPKTEGEKLDESVPVFTEGASKPPIDQYRRGDDTSLRGEEIKDIAIGIEDIDQAVLYYFEEVIKPYVLVEGSVKNVPVVYADPERWKSAQRDGFFRDKEGKVQLPIIAVKREMMEKNRDLTQKLDGNNVNIYQVYEKKYTRKNQYDNFSVLTNRAPVREFYNIVIPDYYTVTYSCAVYVSFMSDLNKILESIGFRSDSYWGKPGRYQFKASIDSFPITNQITDGEDRRISSVFTLRINGYITPSNVDKQLAAKALMSRNKTNIVFTVEVLGTSLDNMEITNKKNPAVSAKAALVANEITVNNIEGNPDLQKEINTYLGTNVSKKAGEVTSNSAVFTNVFMLQPPQGSGLPPTSKYDFKFFVNGVFLPYEHITSFVQSGTDAVLVINPSSLEYDFDPDYEVVAIGKFQ